MDKEFVSYVQAVDLKELGFKEDCFKIVEGGPIDNFPHKQLHVPLKQQAFRWFREKHNIQSSIEWNKSDHVWFTFKIYFEELANGETPPVMVGHIINSWLGLNLEFKTYEEAEDACLDKLIEIVKNSKSA
jgi:hypothetical protein